ncbi:MAG: hypothetical protein HY043_19700 [Verrucomicrobia bacterium]|nr:hypothetical protein [Verrucomicrobiota bacterium]
MKPQHRACLVGFFICLALVVDAVWNRTPTANNDLFVQLRAGDGLHDGQGLNLFAKRRFATRFSPKVSGIAYALNSPGANPLRVLVTYLLADNVSTGPP